MNQYDLILIVIVSLLCAFIVWGNYMQDTLPFVVRRKTYNKLKAKLKKSEKTSAALMHDIGEILDDFRADMIKSYDPDHMKFSIQDIEEKTDNLLKEIKGLH